MERRCEKADSVNVGAMIRAVGRIVLPFIVMPFLAVLLFAQGARPEWRPGEFNGLLTGKATRQDVVRRLGSPKLKTRPEGPNDPELEKWHYDSPQFGIGCCDLLFQSGVLQEVTLELPNVNEETAKQRFGGTFQPVRYSSLKTQIQGGSAPLCEDPTGETLLLANPHSGLYLWVEADGSVSSATFSFRRPGIGLCRDVRR